MSITKIISACLCALVLLVCSVSINAQKTHDTWRIRNMQTTDVLEKSSIKLNIMSRFGEIEKIPNDYFNYEESNYSLSVQYGLMDELELGLGWDAFRNTSSASIKYQIYKKQGSKPLNMSFYSSVHYDTELSADRFIHMKRADRLSYLSQVSISKEVASNFIIQVAPSFVRQNLVLEIDQDHNQYATGFGLTYILSRNLRLKTDYFYLMNRSSESAYTHPFSVGVGVKWKTWYLDMLVNNSKAIHDVGVISNSLGDINYGLNVSFQL